MRDRPLTYMSLDKDDDALVRDSNACHSPCLRLTIIVTSHVPALVVDAKCE